MRRLPSAGGIDIGGSTLQQNGRYVNRKMECRYGVINWLAEKTWIWQRKGEENPENIRCAGAIRQFPRSVRFCILVLSP